MGTNCGEGIYPRWTAKQAQDFGAATPPNGAVRRFAKSPRHSSLPHWYVFAVLAAEVHLDHALVVLHLLQRPFGQHAALVQHGDVVGDGADKTHVVFHHHQ